jgi:hypothetical protein
MHIGATWILRLECAGTAPRGFHPHGRGGLGND